MLTVAGDTVSFVMLYTEEAIKELNDYLASPSAYLNSTGGIISSSENDVINNILADMTS